MNITSKSVNITSEQGYKTPMAWAMYWSRPARSRCPDPRPTSARRYGPKARIGGHGEYGFLLLEVLVAAAIAALALGVLLQAALGGAALARAAGEYRQALAIARSRLAVAAVALTPGQAEGQAGAYRWHVRTRFVAMADPGTRVVDRLRMSAARRPVLYEVQAAVSWQAAGTKREISLATERLGFLSSGAIPP